MHAVRLILLGATEGNGFDREESLEKTELLKNLLLFRPIQEEKFAKRLFNGLYIHHCSFDYEAIYLFDFILIVCIHIFVTSSNQRFAHFLSIFSEESITCNKYY